MIGITLTCLGLVAVIFGSAVHFWILARLEGVGLKVKYFATTGDTLRAYNTYRHVARDRHWPLWPSYAVFVGFAGGLLAGLAFFFDSPLLEIERLLRLRIGLGPVSAGILLWIFFTSLLVALFFSRRVKGGIKAHARPHHLRSLKAVLSSGEYLRSDIYGALIGFAGCTISLLALAFLVLQRIHW